MTIETQDDIVALKRIGKIVSAVLQKMLDAAEPGMTTRELDSPGERLLAEQGARSAPRLTYNFPGATCISINEQAAHGVPGDRIIRAGDVLNVDVSAELDSRMMSLPIFGWCISSPVESKASREARKF